MMFRKAMLFKGIEVAQQVLRAKALLSAKALRRQIQRYGHERWGKERNDMIETGTYRTFRQKKEIGC